MTNTFTIRPYAVRDHEHLASLYDAAKPLGIAAADSETSDACRLIAMSAPGQIIGYGAASGGKTSSLTLVVHPDWQRRGLGGLLWERLSGHLAVCGTASVEPWVRQENAPGVAWLQKTALSRSTRTAPCSFFSTGRT